MMYRNSQDLFLGLPRGTGSTAYSQTSTTEVAVLLQDVVIDTDQLGLVDEIKVSGQSILASDKGADINAFSPEAQVEGHRSIGIALARQQDVAIDCTLAAAGTVICSVGTAPVDPTRVVEVGKLGPELAYVAGLGSASIGATTTGTLTCSMRKDMVLGLMTLTPASNPLDLTVRSVSINRVEMLSGKSGQNGEGPIGTFANNATDIDGKCIGYFVRVNDVVTITVQNYNAGAITVRGAIFSMPMPPPDA